MEKLPEFLSMGGYGLYVWPAFFAAALILTVMAAASLRSLRRAEQSLAALQRHET